MVALFTGTYAIEMFARGIEMFARGIEMLFILKA